MSQEKIIRKNIYKGYDTKFIKYAPGEYKLLIKSFEENDSLKVLDIVFKIYYRGHFL